MKAIITQKNVDITTLNPTSVARTEEGTNSDRKLKEEMLPYMRG